MASPLNKIAPQTGTLLILHDQIRFRNPLRRILSLEGYKVYEAGNIEQAAGMAAREDIELILTNNTFTGFDDSSVDILPIPPFNHPTGDEGQGSAFDLKNVERLHLQKVLNFTGGNKPETAKLLNIGLTTLYRKINEYDN